MIVVVYSRSVGTGEKKAIRGYATWMPSTVDETVEVVVEVSEV